MYISFGGRDPGIDALPSKRRERCAIQKCLPDKTEKIAADSGLNDNFAFWFKRRIV